MEPVLYRYVDTDGEVMRGKLYRDGHYHCYVRNKIVRLSSASCGFAVYMNNLFVKSFCA